MAWGFPPIDSCCDVATFKINLRRGISDLGIFGPAGSLGCMPGARHQAGGVMPLNASDAEYMPEDVGGKQTARGIPIMSPMSKSAFKNVRKVPSPPPRASGGESLASAFSAPNC